MAKSTWLWEWPECSEALGALWCSGVLWETLRASQSQSVFPDAIHFCAGQSHGSLDGWVICPFWLRVESAVEFVHGGDDWGDASSITREEKSSLFILLNPLLVKGTDTYKMHKPREQIPDLAQSSTRYHQVWTSKVSRLCQRWCCRWQPDT
jgi:hypothetical protein